MFSFSSVSIYMIVWLCYDTGDYIEFWMLNSCINLSVTVYVSLFLGDLRVFFCNKDWVFFIRNVFEQLVFLDVRVCHFVEYLNLNKIFLTQIPKSRIPYNLILLEGHVSTQKCFWFQNIWDFRTRDVPPVFLPSLRIRICWSHRINKEVLPFLFFSERNFIELIFFPSVCSRIYQWAIMNIILSGLESSYFFIEFLK